jgi:outer membrane protein OmpA-like peptidoglycan-associated protein
MARLPLEVVIAALTILAADCTRRPHPAPIATAQPPAAPAPTPAPAQNIFALLPDPKGDHTAIVITNDGGTQEIREPNHAVRVQRSDAAPSAAFPIDPSAVSRLFGAALKAVPDPEIRFLLYFDEARDTLNSAAQATMSLILKAVEERHSTDISVTGHTDRTGSTEGNYELGLRRAERVASILRTQGVDDSSLFVGSHGESDPLIKTGPGVAEPSNRRVEVIVH